MRNIVINLSSEDVILQVNGKKEIVEKSGYRLIARKILRPLPYGADILRFHDYKYFLEYPDGHRTSIASSWKEILLIAHMVAQTEGRIGKDKRIEYGREENVEEFFYLIVDKEVADAIARERAYYSQSCWNTPLKGVKPFPLTYLTVGGGGYALCWVQDQVLVM